MAKEEMVDLKIKIPANWAEMIDEYYRITGKNRDKDLRSTIWAGIECDLSLKDRARFIKKYHPQDAF